MPATIDLSSAQSIVEAGAAALVTVAVAVYALYALIKVLREIGSMFSGGVSSSPSGGGQSARDEWEQHSREFDEWNAAAERNKGKPSGFSD